MREDRIRIISNFRGLGRAAGPDGRLTHEYVGDDESATRFIRKCLRADVVIINIGQRSLMLACLLRWVVPVLRFRLVSVDLTLRPPKTWKDRLKVFCKRVLFSRVDRFVLYFTDLRGYERFRDLFEAIVAYNE